MINRVLLFVAILLLPTIGWAVPTPKEVAEQMALGNTTQAEAMTREIVQERPGSAKAHYYLGQILATEGKYQEAYGELTKAAELDKSLSFASSDGKFREELRKVEINIGKVNAPTISSESHIGRDIEILLGLVAALCGIVWVISRRNERKEKAGRDAAKQQELSEQTAKVMALLDRAASLEVTVKLSEAADKAKKLAVLAGIKDDLNDFLTRNKKRKELISDISIARVEKSLRQVETGDFSTGEGTRNAAASSLSTFRPEPSRPSHEPQTNHTTSYVASSPSPTVTNTYVNSGSGNNGGFVEGMLLGEMMSGRESRTIQRETIIERPVERDNEDNNSRFDDSRSDSFDSGSDSGFDSGSDSSFDSGGGGDSSW